MNLGSTFHAYEIQILIEIFSKHWPSTSLGRHRALQAPEWRSRGAGQPRIFLQEEAGFWGGEVNAVQLTPCSLSEPNLQGSACEMRTAGWEGARGFYICGPPHAD